MTSRRDAELRVIEIINEARDENRRLREALKASRELLASRELRDMENIGFNHGVQYSQAFIEKAERAKALAEELLK